MAVEGSAGFLQDAAIYLGATAVAVPLFRRLKLGAILGLLFAGALLGPHVLRWLRPDEDVFHIAELGVVLFLFVIGLELSVSRLWRLRKRIFGLGLAQMVATTFVLATGLWLARILPPGPAIVVGAALACSSTAFVLSFLDERHERNSAHGENAFSILLLQDIAVVPLLASIPLLANFRNGETFMLSAAPLLWAVVAVAAVILFGRFVLPFLLRLIAISGSREAFGAAALFTVAATALGMQYAGLSMALGAFLAGVMLAESNFRHQVEADIEPFRQLLLGLFFIGVGAQLDLGAVFAALPAVLVATLALVALKALVLYGLARAFGEGHAAAVRTGAYLSQGGEFAFVVLTLATQEALLPSVLASQLAAVITLSMVLTPLVAFGANRLARPRVGAIEVEALGEGRRATVMIVGYGRIGHVIDQILRNSGVKVIAIDNDPKRIELAARFGNQVYFGDGHNMPFMLHAGALSVDAIIYTLDAGTQLRTTLEAIRERCPNVRILARVRDRIQELEVMDVETSGLVRETFESAIDLGQRALRLVGYTDDAIGDITAQYRLRDRARLMAQKAGGILAGQELLHQQFEGIDPPTAPTGANSS